MADKRKPAASGRVRNIQPVDVDPAHFSYTSHEGSIDLGKASVAQSRGFKEGDRIRSGDREFIVRLQEDGSFVLIDTKSLS